MGATDALTMIEAGADQIPEETLLEAFELAHEEIRKIRRGEHGADHAINYATEDFVARNPNHPGAAHYILHAYDHASLAARSLPAARVYAKIAPSASHALHMPSHTFTRVGAWQDSIDTNIASAEAADLSWRRTLEFLREHLGQTS